MASERGAGPWPGGPDLLHAPIIVDLTEGHPRTKPPTRKHASVKYIKNLHQPWALIIVN